MVHQVLPTAPRPGEEAPDVQDLRHLVGLGHVLRVIAVEAHGRRARANLDRDERRRVELGLD